ncbi:MAG: glycosyltransferase family 2 protein [Bacteroidetes bacterium]|nr:glycosyltransferase family 2 protein [Bacteroidota bacterium]
MNDPLISIIIPCYNITSRFKLLEQALSSIFCQTYHHYAVIIVDDGSSDGTGDCIDSYLEALRTTRKVACKRLFRNEGPSVARNKGIHAASGEFISFLDFD